MGNIKQPTGWVEFIGTGPPPRIPHRGHIYRFEEKELHGFRRVEHIIGKPVDAMRIINANRKILCEYDPSDKATIRANMFVWILRNYEEVAQFLISQQEAGILPSAPEETPESEEAVLTETTKEEESATDSGDDEDGRTPSSQ